MSVSPNRGAEGQGPLTGREGRAPRSSGARSRWRSRALAPALVAVCLGLAGSAVALRQAEDAPASPAAFLAAREAVLRERLALARTDTLQLVLDPESGTLTLARGGTTLREWPVTEVEAGRRRLGFGRGPERADWRVHAWRGGTVDPPVRVERRVIVTDDSLPPDLTGAVDWIPPTPEEAVPTPLRFVVHYPDGLGVEVVAQGHGDARRLRGLPQRLRFLVREMMPRRWDRYRVRLVMPAAEAGALYRSFPSGAVFLAVLPES
jgi:hypothetical protein